MCVRQASFGCKLIVLLTMSSVLMTQQYLLNKVSLRLPQCLSGKKKKKKKSTYNAGAAGDPGLIPGSGRAPWRRKWQLTPVLLPGESHGQRSLSGYSP